MAIYNECHRCSTCGHREFHPHNVSGDYDSPDQPYELVDCIICFTFEASKTAKDARELAVMVEEWKERRKKERQLAHQRWLDERRREQMESERQERDAEAARLNGRKLRKPCDKKKTVTLRIKSNTALKKVAFIKSNVRRKKIKPKK